MKLFLFAVFTSFILSSCDSLQNLPTNTSGNLFSLNGTWQLDKTSDGNALVGTSITVYPVSAQGTITVLANNTYCVRETDAMWTEIKSSGAGGFTLNNLVNSCGGTVVYKPATLTALTNDRVRVTGQNASGIELTQEWVRVKNQ